MAKKKSSKQELKEMQFEFDESKHLYTLDGRRLIGVTEALSILDDRWKVDPFYLERGRFIHKATELYDLGELDDSTVDERIRPYLDGYIKFEQDTDFAPTFIERTLYHPKYFYGMRIDRIGWLNERWIMLDLKSGAPAKVDKLQGVAYLEGCWANGIEVKTGFDLYLRDDGNYSLVEVEKPKLLLPIFLAALKCVQWREAI